MRSGRGGNASSRREPAVELDWGSARNSQLPTRQRSNRNIESDQSNENNTPTRAPRRQEPELDWGSARGAKIDLPPRQRSIEISIITMKIITLLQELQEDKSLNLIGAQQEALELNFQLEKDLKETTVTTTKILPPLLKTI